MLTRKQHELLLCINRRIAETGISPSFEEMKEALGLKSKSGIHRLITGLEERGFIRRLPHRARALEVMRMPETAAYGTGKPALADPLTGERANIIRGKFRPDSGRDAHVVALPVYGRIAAGTPIEALKDHSISIDVPAGMLGRGAYYALEVEGDSMVDAGILDGDTVIIERAEQAENGTIVVALVDDSEVTLKRLRQRGASVALEAANAEYETRIFPPDRVKIQGRLLALVRQY